MYSAPGEVSKSTVYDAKFRSINYKPFITTHKPLDLTDCNAKSRRIRTGLTVTDLAEIMTTYLADLAFRYCFCPVTSHNLRESLRSPGALAV